MVGTQAIESSAPYFTSTDVDDNGRCRQLNVAAVPEPLRRLAASDRRVARQLAFLSLLASPQCSNQGNAEAA